MSQQDLFEGEALPVQASSRESDIQDECIRWARKQGAYCRKFSSPANRSVPDYVIVFDGRTYFVEFKAPGKQPTEQQKKEHDAIRAARGMVWLCSSLTVFQDLWFVYT